MRELSALLCLACLFLFAVSLGAQTRAIVSAEMQRYQPASIPRSASRSKRTRST
jgi:hypothetical protein